MSSSLMTSEQSNNLKQRRKSGVIWQTVIFLATIMAVIALATLILNIFNSSFGYVAIQNSIEPKELIFQVNLNPEITLNDLDTSELLQIIDTNLRRGLKRALNAQKPLADRNQLELVKIIVSEIVKPQVVHSWSLKQSIFNRNQIKSYMQNELPKGWLQFRSWVNPELLWNDLSTTPEKSGLRTPIIGSLMVIMITILFSFPVGVGTAVYLEELAKDNKLNRFIQLNIYNLSGVPSIIYGLLGLAIFVRILEPLTSGSIFGFGDDTGNGRTILSAGLTLGLLILPIIIINAQEAIRAVPKSLRDSSYGLGATKWQTVWHHVLPASMDRILTGTIIAVSRALGETAPLVVVGASAFLTRDPSSIFDKFTTLPIMIYRWTSYPQAEFRRLAAAAIVVLLIVLLSMNASAIILRNRISKKRKLTQ